MMSSLLGLGIVVVAIGDWLLRLVTARAARTTRTTDVYVLIGLLMTGVTVGMFGQPAWRFFLALALATLWFALSRAELRLRARPSASPDVGATLPPFDGRDRVLKAAPAALVLLRGPWCFFCKAQLADAVAQERALAEAGLDVFFLVHGDPITLEPLRARLAKEGKGRLHLIVDPSGDALTALGRFGKASVPWYDRRLLGAPADTALPAAFLVGKDGKILWARLARTIDDRVPVGELLWARARAS